MVDGLPRGPLTLTHYRVDADHSNAYHLWKSMGSPQPPRAAQYMELERAGKLETIGAPQRVVPEASRVAVGFALPRQGVSLIRLTW